MSIKKQPQLIEYQSKQYISRSEIVKFYKMHRNTLEYWEKNKGLKRASIPMPGNAVFYEFEHFLQIKKG